MNDEDIKKALECCVSDDYDESCIKCPVRKYKGCDYTLHKNALDLINRQQAVIDDLKRDTVPKLQDSLNRANKYGRATDRENARLKAEIEQLQRNLKQCENGYSQELHLARCKIEELKSLCTSEDKLIKELRAEIKQAKSEAIKEFAERFIDEECAYCSSESDEMIFFKKRFDNFLAEMEGGKNA